MSARDYMQLADAFRFTKGHAIYWLIHSISISYGTFAGNEQELLRKLEQHADFASLWEFDGLRNRTKLQAEFREIIRLLHNYVASTKSLVDHTRRIARKLLIGKHLDEYQKRVDSNFKEDSLTTFLQDLRNYLLHVSYPPVNRTIRFEPTHIKSVGIELAVKQLLKWDGWNSRSLDFIKSHDDGIALAGLVSEYSTKVLAFYDWLQKHIEVACKSELDEFWTKHDEWANFCKEHKIPTTDEEFKRAFAGEH